jgi:hypothetical protein
MPNNEAEAIKISRLLTKENKANLLAWVRLAYFAEKSALAEKSAKKSLGIDAVNSGVSISEPREYTCGKSLQRSKK